MDTSLITALTAIASLAFSLMIFITNKFGARRKEMDEIKNCITSLRHDAERISPIDAKVALQEQSVLKNTGDIRDIQKDYTSNLEILRKEYKISIDNLTVSFDNLSKSLKETMTKLSGNVEAVKEKNQEQSTDIALLKQSINLKRGQ